MLKHTILRLIASVTLSVGVCHPVVAFPRPLSPEESEFARLISAFPVDTDIGQITCAAGKLFLGRPYVAGSLNVTPDPTKTEMLVCRLDAFDCVTLVEMSLALARTCVSETRDWKQLQSELETLRYRGGQRGGFATRLHYFSDWIRDNAARGIVQDLTSALGGLPDTKPLTFMTSHRSAYRQLARDDVWSDVRRTEEALGLAPRAVIPKRSLPSVIPFIKSGDILAFATSVPGLDVAHVGLAIRLEDGNLHLLHAPEPGNRVQISREPLVSYTRSIPAHIGLMVARPLAMH